MIAVTGCSNLSKNDENSEVEATYSIKYTDDYYKIYKPYKKGVGNNYILNSNVVDFDVQTIEKDLIQISTNAFDTEKYYYQEGQYLTKKTLKKLLSVKELNKYDKKEIDGKKVEPEIIAAIYEKNFLNKNGEIKGVSLGLVLNRYHAYDSNNNYVTMDKDDVVEFGKTKGLELVKYMREEYNLENIPILVALYLEASPESNIGGNYLYYGVTDNNEMKYKYINQKSYYMNHSKVKDMDSESYNNFKKFEEKIRDYDNSIYISGIGYFNGNDIYKLDIKVSKNYYSYGDLLYINQLLSDYSIKYFKDINVMIEVKAINEIKSYIVKEPGKTTTDIFIY